MQLKGKRVHATDEEKIDFLKAILAGKDPLAVEREKEAAELLVIEEERKKRLEKERTALCLKPPSFDSVLTALLFCRERA